MGAVVRPDARPRGQIEEPNYVSVERTRLEHGPVNGRMQWLGLYRGAGYRFGRRTETLGRRHVCAFVAKRAVVAVGHSLGVETHDFAAIVCEVNPVILDGDR